MLWNQDGLSSWVFVADNRDISKLKVEKIMWASTSSLSVYRWDSMFHSWHLHRCILCFRSSHKERRNEKPTGKPDCGHCLIICVALLFSLCHLFLYQIILIILFFCSLSVTWARWVYCLHLFENGRNPYNICTVKIVKQQFETINVQRERERDGNGTR